MFAPAQPLIDLEKLPQPLIQFATVSTAQAVTGIGNLIFIHLRDGNEQAFITARAAARVHAAVQGPQGAAELLHALETSPRYQALPLEKALLLASEIDCGAVVEHYRLQQQAIRIDAEHQWDAALAVQDMGLDLGLNPADHPRLNR